MSAEVENVASGDSALLARLQEYSIYNTAVETYQSIKGSSAIATKSLDFCESVAQRGIEVSIPVIRRVDEYAHLDEKSVALLDVLESKAAAAKDGFDTVRTAAQQPLDTVIDLLDQYVPASPIAPTEDSDQEKKQSVPSEEKEQSLTDAKELPPIQKLTAIGAHLTHASSIKLRELQLRGPVQEQVASNMWEIITYTNGVLHLDKVGDSAANAQRALFNQAAQAATNFQSFIESSPTLSAIENSLQPVLATSKGALESSAVRLIATLHVATELTSQFFDSTYVPIKQVADNAAQWTAAFIGNLRKNNPNIESSIQNLLSGLSAGIQRSRELYNQIAAVPRERLYTTFTSMYSMIENLHTLVLSFQENLALSAKHDAERLEHPSTSSNPQEELKKEQNQEDEQEKKQSEEQSSPKDDTSNSDAPSSSAPSGSAGSKKRRGGKH